MININPFVVPWKWFLSVHVDMGADAVDLGLQQPSSGSIQEVKLEKDSIFYLMSNNVPACEWCVEHRDANIKWKQWIRKNIERGAQIRVISGPYEDINIVECYSSIGVQFGQVDEISETHIGLVTTPRQIWFESYHPNDSHKAYGCYYTCNPDPSVFERYKLYLEDLWKRSAKYSTSQMVEAIEI